MTETRIHPVTGETLTRGVRPQMLSFGSLSREVDVPGWYPEGDGDAIHTGVDLAADEEAFKALKKEYGDRVKMIRKSLKLTQEEAGYLIGGGPRAFQKYEKGVMAPSDAAVGLLELLYAHPEHIEVLKNLKQGRSAVGVVPAAPQARSRKSRRTAIPV